VFKQLSGTFNLSLISSHGSYNILTVVKSVPLLKRVSLFARATKTVLKYNTFADPLYK